MVTNMYSPKLALLVMSDWWVVQMSWKDVWKSVTMNNGALFVMMAGVLLMLEWFAHNLVSRTEVLSEMKLRTKCYVN